MNRLAAFLIVGAVAIVVVLVIVFVVARNEPPVDTGECTEADGACLTWDDIRNTETHTQETEPGSW